MPEQRWTSDLHWDKEGVKLLGALARKQSSCSTLVAKKVSQWVVSAEHKAKSDRSFSVSYGSCVIRSTPKPNHKEVAANVCAFKSLDFFYYSFLSSARKMKIEAEHFSRMRWTRVHTNGARASAESWTVELDNATQSTWPYSKNVELDKGTSWPDILGYRYNLLVGQILTNLEFR